MTARTLALEALKACTIYACAGGDGAMKNRHLAAIAALEAETGEPVIYCISYDGKTPYNNFCSDRDTAEETVKRVGGTAVTMPLYAAPPPAVPPGWKLVPIEPTEAMWKAGLAHLFRDVDAVWRAMLAEVPDATVSTVSQWIPVTERMPVGGCKVFVFYRNSYGLGRRTCAHYAPLHTIDASHWEDGEPDETEDGVFEPKGWWEEQVEAGQVTFISDEVTHWMPLPEDPK